MGGIPTDVNGRVLSDHKGGVIEGVYAAGETIQIAAKNAPAFKAAKGLKDSLN